MGWLVSYTYSDFANDLNLEKPEGGIAKPSPFDRVSESQIYVYKDRVIINQPDVQWASYADTHSMEPVLKAGANGLELIPKSEEDLHLGDIVAYKAVWSDGLVVHRIVGSGKDNTGVYYILRGDNNSSPDPGKVRFEQIKYVLIGVIY